MRRLLAIAIVGIALAACGDSGVPPQQRAGAVLMLDVKVEQPYQQPAILGASLLLDGKQVAQFQQSRPEITVVFSKQLAGVAAGKHAVAVRIDAQAGSPTPYSGGGFATYAGKQLPMMGTGATLATGEALRWDLDLQAPR
ncbi:MAG TPA: hypothetical protein VGS57_09990 [Thermoanaerobaculia bacterium]|jgi:hypothetical protein|nr:hypothetical protein [Thermoanaerobaculia bacterium]